MVIKFNSVSKNYRQFSLQYKRRFFCKGRDYESLYHYLMTLKYLRVTHKGVNVEEEIYKLKDAKEINLYLANKTIKPSKIWEDNKVAYLKEAIRVKTYADEEFKHLLLETGDSILEYLSPMDNEWSRGTNDNNSNLLGKVLMEVRNSIK